MINLRKSPKSFLLGIIAGPLLVVSGLVWCHVVSAKWASRIAPGFDLRPDSLEPIAFDCFYKPLSTITILGSAFYLLVSTQLLKHHGRRYFLAMLSYAVAVEVFFFFALTFLYYVSFT